MADVPAQYSQVYTLGVKPGIKRDGTVFESREFSDGVWCRFQRGVPKKIGGFRQMFASLRGIARGIIMNAYNGVNYVFTGISRGIDVYTTGTTLGQGSGPFPATIKAGYSQLAVASNTSGSFTIASSPARDLTPYFPNGTKVIFSQSNPVPYTVTGATYAAPNTTVSVSGTIAGSPASVWFYDYKFTPDADLLWQFDMQYSPQGGSLQVIAHPGLNLVNIDNAVATQVLVGGLLPVGQTWTFQGLSDSAGAFPTYTPIVADGGACVLYPYLFVYGSNGFIANNHVSTTYGSQSIFDWNGATANRVNMTAGKIVKGMPMRGGTNSPSGLFWATDSLIRVSYTGQAGLYWRYDIISSQTSIMSSSSVVEMDGVYYWMGVDRFYLYNGSVQVLSNDKNVNWLFNNLNYEQRQKVWATKVPRYNEIWFFYPRGSATECTDAIIYNVKDKLWYDAGQAVGAQRSCGYTTEVFPTPVWCDWNYDVAYSRAYLVVATPSGQPAPTSKQFYIAGNQTPVFAPGSWVQFSNTPGDPVYQITSSVNVYNSTIGTPGVTLVTCSENFAAAPAAGDDVYVTYGGYGIYQQEYGLNQVTNNSERAVLSSFTTCDISWVGGTPSEDTAVGVNRRLHLRRVEPDFVQGGEMTMTVLGRKFARGPAAESIPFSFGPDTEKIDMRIENRESRLQFVSNVLNGDYEMGRILITAEYGDERP